MKKFKIILIVVAVLSVVGLAIMTLYNKREETKKSTAKPKFVNDAAGSESGTDESDDDGQSSIKEV